MSGPQRLVNKQFNSPIGLYSEQNIKEVLDRETQMLANGAVGINFHNPSTTKPANLHNSAVLRMLEEEESRQRNGQSPGVKRVAWPPPKDEEEGDFEEQEAIQAQGGAQYSSKTPGSLSSSQTTPFNNHQQAPVVAQTYQPVKPKPFQSVSAPQPYQPSQSVGSPQPYQTSQFVSSPQPYQPNQSVGAPQPYQPSQSVGSPQPYQPSQSVGSPQPYQPSQSVVLPQPYQPSKSVASFQLKSQESNWTTYSSDQSISLSQTQQFSKPVGSPQPQQPSKSVGSPQPQQPSKPVHSPQPEKPSKTAAETNQSVSSPQVKLPTWAPAFKPSASSPLPIVKEPNWTTYSSDQSISLSQTQQSSKPVGSPQPQQPSKSVGLPQPQQPSKPVDSPQPQQPSKTAAETNQSVSSPQVKLPTWAPAFTPSASSPLPIVKEPNWTTYLPDKIVIASPQPNSEIPTWSQQQPSKPAGSSQSAPQQPSAPQPAPKEYTIPIQIESRVQPTNKPNQDTIPEAGPQGQVQQPQPQYKPAPVKQVEPPPSIITLRPTVPISQAPAPLITSQPATATLRGGKNLRGDMKWPPENVKERMEAEDRAREELAQGPAVKPRKVHKDYSGFFAQHALNSSYPGYKVPPGTQYYEHHPVM